MTNLLKAKRLFRGIGRWIRCLLNPGYVAHLEDIIRHVDLHGAYKRGGYSQMTTAEKMTFDRLARQPWSNE